MVFQSLRERELRIVLDLVIQNSFTFDATKITLFKLEDMDIFPSCFCFRIYFNGCQTHVSHAKFATKLGHVIRANILRPCRPFGFYFGFRQFELGYYSDDRFKFSVCLKYCNKDYYYY